MGKGRGPKQRVQLQVRCFPGLSRVSPGTCGGFRQRSVNNPDRRVNSQGRGQGFKKKLGSSVVDFSLKLKLFNRNKYELTKLYYMMKNSFS